MKKMRIFLTEFYANDKTFCGERIYAISWRDAENQAYEMGLNVVGEWVEDINEETGYRTVNPNFN